MSEPLATPLRIAVVGGGPAGSFFALHALKYARAAGRDVAVTIYEGRDFRRAGPPGCNMCAGILPVSDLRQFRELGLIVPPDLILSRINSYALHTSACTLHATQPDADAEIISVYRGSGPRHGPDLGPISFDELVLQEAVSKGATLRRSFVETVQRGRQVEVTSAGQREKYDLVVLATGVNGRSLLLEGFDYRPPPRSSMCQTELHLGQDEVERRLGSSVHIFLPPDDVAAYGILIPKGPFVTASLLAPANQMRSMHRFLELDEVKTVLGADLRRVCGCMPRITVGLARNIVDDGFVAVGDLSAARLYKNGIGSALATAERAAWTAVYRGHSKAAFSANYLPLCRAIHNDNRIGRLLFLQVPMLKRFRVVPMVHCRLASEVGQRRGVSDPHARIMWGMFTGAYLYRHMLRLAASPSFMLQLGLALGRSMLSSRLPVRCQTRGIDSEE